MPILKLNDYSIHIGDCWQALREFVAAEKYTKIAVLTDENCRLHCLPFFLQNVAFEAIAIEIPAGETHKNLDTCRQVWQEMMQHGLDRRSLLLNLGGGVTGDLGGFCAATYLRGIDFVQIPTTLLAQVDASIGGKVGVDFNFVKNSIGVFQNLTAVFIEPLFLKTLPERELRSGFAEIVKHALIADAGLWESLQNIAPDLLQVDWASHLLPSLQIKKRIVEADPQELGLRKILNFGHTMGHAVESFLLQKKQPLTHGEAIAVGMICESWLSQKTTDLPPGNFEKITAFLHRIFPSIALTINDFSAIFDLMKLDKKNTAGQVNFTLLNAVGEALTDQFCEEKMVRESFEFYLLSTALSI